MGISGCILDTSYNASVGMAEAVYDSAVCSAKTIAGVVGSLASVLTLGLSSKINEVADYTRHSALIVPHIYIAIGKVVNTDFYFDGNTPSFTNDIATPILREALLTSKDDDFFVNTVVSRSLFACGAIVGTITSIADFAFGVIAAVFSIIPCLGRVKAINVYAANQLMALNGISIFCFGLRGVVNPQQYV